MERVDSIIENINYFGDRKISKVNEVIGERLSYEESDKVSVFDYTEKLIKEILDINDIQEIPRLTRPMTQHFGKRVCLTLINYPDETIRLMTKIIEDKVTNYSNTIDEDIKKGNLDISKIIEVFNHLTTRVMCIDSSFSIFFTNVTVSGGLMTSYLTLITIYSFYLCLVKRVYNNGQDLIESLDTRFTKSSGIDTSLVNNLRDLVNILRRLSAITSKSAKKPKFARSEDIDRSIRDLLLNKNLSFEAALYLHNTILNEREQTEIFNKMDIVSSFSSSPVFTRYHLEFLKRRLMSENCNIETEIEVLKKFKDVDFYQSHRVLIADFKKSQKYLEQYKSVKMKEIVTGKFLTNKDKTKNKVFVIREGVFPKPKPVFDVTNVIEEISSHIKAYTEFYRRFYIEQALTIDIDNSTGIVRLKMGKTSVRLELRVIEISVIKLILKNYHIDKIQQELCLSNDQVLGVINKLISLGILIDNKNGKYGVASKPVKIKTSIEEVTKDIEEKKAEVSTMRVIISTLEEGRTSENKILNSFKGVDPSHVKSVLEAAVKTGLVTVEIVSGSRHYSLANDDSESDLESLPSDAEEGMALEDEEVQDETTNDLRKERIDDLDGEERVNRLNKDVELYPPDLLFKKGLEEQSLDKFSATFDDDDEGYLANFNNAKRILIEPQDRPEPMHTEYDTSYKSSEGDTSDEDSESDDDNDENMSDEDNNTNEDTDEDNDEDEDNDTDEDNDNDEDNNASNASASTNSNSTSNTSSSSDSDMSQD